MWQISRMPPPTRWGASFTAGLAHKGISSAEGRAVPWGGPPFAWGDLHAGAAVRGDGARGSRADGQRRTPRGSRGASKRTGKRASKAVAEGPNGETERPAAGLHTVRAGVLSVAPR